MGGNVFTGGVEPGGLTYDFEIKIFVCFLLHRVGQPMTFEQMNEVVFQNGVANYFEFAEAVGELEHSGHIRLLPKDQAGRRLYTITDIGIQTAEAFHKDIPLTIREKALTAAQEVLIKSKLKSENLVSIQKAEDGYLVELRITDVGSDLLKLTVFMPDKKQASQVCSRFQEDPARLYKSVLALLTGEGAIFSESESKSRE